MKLLIISTMSGFPWGGSEELWYETALYAHQHSVTVNVILFNREIIAPQIKYLQKTGIPVHFIEKHSGANKTFSKRIKDKLAKSYKPSKSSERFNFIRNLKSDLIVLSQGTCTEITHYTDLAEFLVNDTTPLAIVNHHNVEGGIIPKTQKKILLDFFTRANHLFFVSKRNRDVLERQLAFRFPNSRIAKNPFKLMPNNIAWPETKSPQFAVVGRLDINCKGQDILLETISHSKWKKRNFVLNFYGEGPDKEFIESLIDFYDLRNRVKLLGHISNIEEIWKQNHLLILPSLSEGLPITIIEAMTAGRPCLVTDVGDSALLILENQTGWVSPVCSVSALDNALEKAWEQQSNWMKMGEQAKKVSFDFIEKNAGEAFFLQLTNGS